VYLILSIVLSTILGFLLLMTGPLIGGVLAFGIVVGCLFRGLYILNDLSKRLSEVAPKTNKVKDVYTNYLKENEKSIPHLEDKDAYLNYLKDKEKRSSK
jgi:hypothetical protein